MKPRLKRSFSDNTTKAIKENKTTGRITPINKNLVEYLQTQIDALDSAFCQAGCSELEIGHDIVLVDSTKIERDLVYQLADIRQATQHGVTKLPSANLVTTGLRCNAIKESDLINLFGGRRSVVPTKNTCEFDILGVLDEKQPMIYSVECKAALTADTVARTFKQQGKEVSPIDERDLMRVRESRRGQVRKQIKNDSNKLPMILLSDSSLHNNQYWLLKPRSTLYPILVKWLYGRNLRRLGNMVATDTGISQHRDGLLGTKQVLATQKVTDFYRNETQSFRLKDYELAEHIHLRQEAWNEYDQQMQQYDDRSKSTNFINDEAKALAVLRQEKNYHEKVSRSLYNNATACPSPSERPTPQQYQRANTWLEQYGKPSVPAFGRRPSYNELEFSRRCFDNLDSIQKEMTSKEHIRSITVGTEVSGLTHEPLFSSTITFSKDDISDARVARLGRNLIPSRLARSKTTRQLTTSASASDSDQSRSADSQGASRNSHKKRQHRALMQPNNRIFSHQKTSATPNRQSNSKRPRL